MESGTGNHATDNSSSSCKISLENSKEITGKIDSDDARSRKNIVTDQLMSTGVECPCSPSTDGKGSKMEII